VAPPRRPHRRDEAASSKRTAAGSSKRNHENEPPQHHLVGLAEQNGEIFHRTKISLDGATLALHSGPLDLQVGEGLRLNHQLVGKAVALGLPSSAARSLEIGDVLKVMARNRTTNGGGAKRCTSLKRRPCSPSARTSAPLGGPDR